eukprot:1137388-Pelagomonas_calceolata.AAC.2
MRRRISAGACARDPGISHVINGLACLIFSNSICTFVTSNDSMGFYFVEMDIVKVYAGQQPVCIIWKDPTVSAGTNSEPHQLEAQLASKLN